MTFLRFSTTYDLPATKEYDPVEFFRMRDELYVGGELVNLVLSQVGLSPIPNQEYATINTFQT